MKKIILIIPLLICYFSVFSASFPDCPPNVPYVNDFGNYLSEGQRQDLEMKAGELYEKTGIPVYVFLTDSSMGVGSPNSVAAFGNRWGLYERYNGDVVIILSHPPYKTGRGSAFVMAEKMKGKLPSSITSVIEQEDLIPYVEYGDFYNGVLASINHLERRLVFIVGYLWFVRIFALFFILSPVLYFISLSLVKPRKNISVFEIFNLTSYEQVSENISEIEQYTNSDFSDYRLKLQNRFAYVLGKKRNKKILVEITLHEMLCLLLMGGTRWRLFWTHSSFQLKVASFLVLIFPVCLHIYCFYIDLLLVVFVLVSIMEILFIPFCFSIMTSLIEIPARSKTRKPGRTSIAEDWLALKALTSLSIRRYLDPVTEKVYYKYKKRKPSAWAQIETHYN